MEFGRKLLSKFGWEEGKGLGKSENGIVAPLRPKLKFDSTGIGFDYSKEYVNDWWAQKYNEALLKVDVSKKKSKKEKLLVKDQNQNKSKNFIKTETLLQDGSFIPEAIIHNEIAESNEPTPLDYEKLFEICGGRTAHKGARHGLGLNGKLARLEAQERSLGIPLQQALQNSPSESSSSLIQSDLKCSSKMKTLKSSKLQQALPNSPSENHSSCIDWDLKCSSSSKQKKKLKSSKFEENIVMKAGASCIISVPFPQEDREEQGTQVCRKRKKMKRSDIDEDLCPKSKYTEIPLKDKKHKRKKLSEVEEVYSELENYNSGSKSKNETSDEKLFCHDFDEVLEDSKSRKKKCKK